MSYISAETAWQAALVLGVVGYLTGLGYAFGPELGRAGYVLLLWTSAVLIGEAHGGDPPATALAFLIGGAVAMLVVAAAGAVQAVRGGAGDGVPPVPRPNESSGSPPSVGGAVRSGIGIWSLLRAVLVVIATLVGYWLTDSDLDPFWTAIVLLIVFQPDLQHTIFKATQRGLGTLVGATTAAALVSVTGSEPVIVAVALVGTFGAVAFYNANYMIYAFFLTNAVLLYYWFAADQNVSEATERLAATVIGIALAIAGVGVLKLRERRSIAATQTA